MVIEKREKREKEAEAIFFTCIMADDDLVSMMAKSFQDVDNETGRRSVLIIHGTAESVGAKQISQEEHEMGKPFDWMEENEKPVGEGHIYVFSVGDPYMFNAECSEKMRLSSVDGLLLVKDDIEIWAFPNLLRFHSVDGESLY